MGFLAVYDYEKPIPYQRGHWLGKSPLLALILFCGISRFMDNPDFSAATVGLGLILLLTGVVRGAGQFRPDGEEPASDLKTGQIVFYGVSAKFIAELLVILGPIVEAIVGAERPPVERDISVFYLVLSIFVGPYFEELFFRSVLFHWFKFRWGTLAAVVGINVAFGLSHTASFPAFGAGMVFSLIYLRTRNLWFAIMIHMIGNAISYGFAVWMTTRPQDENWVYLGVGVLVLSSIYGAVKFWRFSRPALLRPHGAL